LRWGNSGPVCPHCGGAEPYRLTPKPGSSTRKGVLKCKACRKQFTVTVGTVFEDSHVKLTKWLQAIYLVGASKKGISAHQLHRMLGVTYRAAWFMAHRLRYAMSAGAFTLKGTVEIDEGYIGGKRKGGRGRRPADGGRKAAVAVLVERNGNVRAMPMQRIDGESMEREIRNYVDPGSRLMTDETNIYSGVKVKGQQRIAGMERNTVNHGSGEFVRGDIHTNTAEGFISLLKRGIVGTFHHVGKGHLGKYVSEFEFRYNARKASDAQRPVLIVQASEGKRLTYKQPVGASQN
ncbi:MAG TPA: IS1595 family transposase, partial [Vicinamibacterales bacterium]|nr:IS1595 family transposase [Vicinamibacterales bacterium]